MRDALGYVLLAVVWIAMSAAIWWLLFPRVDETEVNDEHNKG